MGSCLRLAFLWSLDCFQKEGGSRRVGSPTKVANGTRWLFDFVLPVVSLFLKNTSLLLKSLTLCTKVVRLASVLKVEALCRGVSRAQLVESKRRNVFGTHWRERNSKSTLQILCARHWGRTCTPFWFCGKNLSQRNVFFFAEV